MNLKKIIALLLLVLLAFLGVQQGMKKYFYPYNYKEYVEKYSNEYNLDPLLVLSVIKAESKFKENSTSSKGAKGLMQIMDSTGQWISSNIEISYFLPHMLYDPEINIKMGCWYLNNLIEQFGNVDTALAAYNAGSGNVSQWLQDSEYSKDGETLYNIPFAETKKYVDKIKVNYKMYKYSTSLEDIFYSKQFVLLNPLPLFCLHFPSPHW